MIWKPIFPLRPSTAASSSIEILDSSVPRFPRKRGAFPLSFPDTVGSRAMRLRQSATVHPSMRST